MSDITKPATCEGECHCQHQDFQETKLIVVTGGPGAGKTAVLEILRKQLCRHVVILPEAASLIFGGGFWRLPSLSARMASQRAILHIQQELERMAAGEHQWPLCLCDRGVLDGLAYWPGDMAEFWDAGRTSLEAEYARYYAVIHLRTPAEAMGYNNHSNPLRTENASQARVIDDKIAAIWSKHPRYHAIESMPDFLDKVAAAEAFILNEVPACCRPASPPQR